MEHFRIATPRLIIRPHQSEDAPLLNQALLDSFNELHQWLYWAKTPPTLGETAAYIEHSQKCWAQEAPKELPLLIFDSQEKVLLGSTGFHSINWEIKNFVIGYWIHTHYSGNGFITEAINALTRFAFLHWNARRVEICCDTENTKSANIPKKLNFELEGHLKMNRVRPSGKISGTLVFATFNIDNLPELYPSIVS